MVESRLEDVYIPDSMSAEDIEYFERSGFGKQLEWGDSVGLLVVDMTEEFTSEKYAMGREDTGSKAVASIERLLEKARELELPVYFTRANEDYPAEYQGVWHEKKFDPQTDSRPGNEIREEIAPRSSEVVIDKGKPSAFFGTMLADMLRYRGVDTVLVTGMVTSGCIRATVVDAASHNFKAIVPEECVADRSTLSHEVNLFEMDLKYANVTPLETVLETLDNQ